MISVENLKMRVIIILLTCFLIVQCKIQSKLTESMGQEVIEIGTPIKELPADLEEEPSQENDEDTTSTTIKVATIKEIVRKPKDQDDKSKDVDKIDGVSQEDEEARIEKELAEIYKDSSDYKADSGESKDKANATSADNSTQFDDKPVARMRTNFKFQPNANNPKEIEKFRTSVDEISCERNKLAGTTSSPNIANYLSFNSIIFGAAVLSILSLN